MKKLLSVLLSLLLVFSAVAATANLSFAADVSYNAEEWEVLRLVNKARVAAGVSPLSMMGELQEICDIRADEIVTYFSHYDANGNVPYQDMIKNDNIDYSTIGENIAIGQRSPDSVVDAWMNSPGHRKNILSSINSHIGIGFLDGDYSWVQVFLGFCKITNIRVVSDSDRSYPVGTSIEAVNAHVELTCPCHGVTVMPIIAEMCSGYNPGISGTQTVTVTYKASRVSKGNELGGIYYGDGSDISYENMTASFTVAVGSATVPTTTPTAPTTTPTETTTQAPIIRPIPIETTTAAPVTTTAPPVTTTAPIEEQSSTIEITTQSPVITTAPEPTTAAPEITTVGPLDPTEVFDQFYTAFFYGETTAGEVVDGIKEDFSGSFGVFNRDGIEITSEAAPMGTGYFVVCQTEDGSLYLFVIVITADVNGDTRVTAADARTILRTSAALDELHDEFSLAADVNSDNRITAADARLALRLAAGLA